MHAHVAEGPAPGLDEAQVPVGNATAPDTARPPVVEVAEKAVPGLLPEVHAVRPETGAEAHHVDHARCFGLADQLDGRGQGIGQGLGTHHVLARADRRQGGGHMHLVRRAHEHRVHLGIGAEVVVVQVLPHGPLELGLEVIHALRDDVAEGDDPAPWVGHRFQRVQSAAFHSSWILPVGRFDGGSNRRGMYPRIAPFRQRAEGMSQRPGHPCRGQFPSLAAGSMPSSSTRRTASLVMR